MKNTRVLQGDKDTHVTNSWVTQRDWRAAGLESKSFVQNIAQEIGIKRKSKWKSVPEASIEEAIDFIATNLLEEVASGTHAAVLSSGEIVELPSCLRIGTLSRCQDLYLKSKGQAALG